MSADEDEPQREVGEEQPQASPSAPVDWPLASRAMSREDFDVTDGWLGMADTVASSLTTMRELLLHLRKDLQAEQSSTPASWGMGWQRIAESLDSFNSLVADYSQSGQHINTASAGLQDAIDRLTFQLQLATAPPQGSDTPLPHGPATPVIQGADMAAPSDHGTASAAAHDNSPLVTPTPSTLDVEMSEDRPRPSAKAAGKRRRAPTPAPPQRGRTPTPRPVATLAYDAHKLRELHEANVRLGLNLSPAEVLEQYAFLCATEDSPPSRPLPSSHSASRTDGSRASTPAALPRKKARKTPAQVTKKLYAHFTPPLLDESRPLGGVIAKTISNCLAHSQVPEDQKLEATSASFGTSGMLTLVFSGPPSDTAIVTTRDTIAGLCSTSIHSVSVTRFQPRVCLATCGVQCIDDQGNDIPAATAAVPFHESPVWQPYLERIRAVRWRTVSEGRPSTNMLIVELTDDVEGKVASALHKRPVLFPSGTVQPFVLDDRPKVPQCTRCFTFGHVVSSCTLPYELCVICGSDHPARMHNAQAECCRDTPSGTPCTHVPKCANCGGPHRATAPECPFFQHRYDQGWLQAHNASRPRGLRSAAAATPRHGALSSSSQAGGSHNATPGPSSSQGRQVRFGPATVIPALTASPQTGRGRRGGWGTGNGRGGAQG